MDEPAAAKQPAKARVKGNRKASSFRFPPDALALVDQAAAARYMDRTAFILDAMTKAARETLLDRVVFPVDAVEHDRVAGLVRDPPEPTSAMRELMRRKASWER